MEILGGADVIAMTTHGPRGSVAEAVLRMAEGPVFVQRATHLAAAVRVA
jgi:hypothetical protein